MELYIGLYKTFNLTDHRIEEGNQTNYRNWIKSQPIGIVYELDFIDNLDPSFIMLYPGYPPMVKVRIIVPFKYWLKSFILHKWSISE